MVNIYVGNLAYTLTEDELKSAFAAFGTVERVSLITDHATGRARGFGFVEMPNESEAKSAITSLHDQELKGRKMLVNEARPKEDRPRRPRSEEHQAQQ
jgi:RNA recognition motif-containing protein